MELVTHKIDDLIASRESVLADMKKFQQFAAFSRALTSLGNSIIVRKTFYEGVFCDYIGDLNRGVRWDLELILSGLNEIGIKPESGYVADMCCGDGRLARFLKKMDYKAFGVDCSHDQIQRASDISMELSQGEAEWELANVLDVDSLKVACTNRNIKAGVTTAGSVNCFRDLKQLNAFFKATRVVLKDSDSSSFLLLPVFDEKAIPFFENTFKGAVISHPFVSQKHGEVLAWTSLLFDSISKTLLQPCMVTTFDSDTLYHEFCYESERIWTAQEIETVAIKNEWKKVVSIDSSVVGGGANQWPFKLLIFE